MIGMSKRLHTNDSPLHLLQLEDLAKSVSFIQRKTQGLSAFGVIIALIKCAIKGDGSFNNIALELGILERKTISRVAVYKRITNNAPQFLRAVIGELVKQSSSSISKLCSRHGFTRVLVEDSTFQIMGKGNASNFPGHGNGVSRTAGFKLDLAFDLLTGSTVSQTFTHGTHQDKSLGKHLLNKINPGDLVVRDMGYFVTESFKLIREMSAFWLTRVPANVAITFSNGSSLEKRLRPLSNNFIDEEVSVGTCGMRARLVAVRADKKTATQRRRARNAKSKGRASSQALVRDGWHILLTNVSSDVTAKELFEIYALRWNIETRFKAWKQSLNLGKVFKGVSNEDHYESLILAALIQQLIGFNLAARLSQLKKVVLSMEKLFEALSAQLSALSQSTLSDPIRLRISHVSIEKRSHQPAHVQWLNLLS
jgi:hypothetical protein